jgi:hypothetical protein
LSYVGDLARHSERATVDCRNDARRESWVATGETCERGEVDVFVERFLDDSRCDDGQGLTRLALRGLRHSL